MTGAALARAPDRIAWIDLAKACGMALVFFGHLLEALTKAGAEGAFVPFKWVYSFHMPLFFVLSGCAARPGGIDLPTFLRQRPAARLIPVVFFNAVALAGIWALVPGWLAANPDYTTNGILELLRGHPVFNQLTWFLVCLFTVELLHVGVQRGLTSTTRVLVAALAFYAVGWTLCWQLDEVVRLVPIPANTWYVHEAPVAYALFLVGVALRRTDWLDSSRSVIQGTALLAFAVLFLSFDQNDGPFRGSRGVVMMASSSHGNPLWFALTALAGTALVVQVSRLLPASRAMLAMGRQTLILLGLNGVMVRLVNPGLARWMAGWLPDHEIAVTAAAVLATAASLLATVPAVVLLDRLVPQLVGRPRERGPLIPALAPARMSGGSETGGEATR